MTRLLGIALVGWLLIVAPALAAEEAKAAKTDQEQIVGAWRLPKDEFKSVPNLSDAIEGFILSIDDEGWKLTLEFEQGSQDVSGSYTMEPMYTPKTIDFAIKAGAVELGVVNAIYKLDGEKLTIRFSKDNNKTGRPSDLESDNQDYVTLIFEREKK